MFLCVLILVPLLLSMPTISIDFGEDVYSGYIYSIEHTGNRTQIHLRFSETAGKDEQPSVCIDKKDDAILDGLINTGKKVKVTKPYYEGIKITPFWECAYPVNIEVIEEEVK